MRDSFNYHVKSDRIKWIAIGVALLLVLVFLTAALTNGFKTANAYCWFGHTYTEGSSVCEICGNECQHKSWKAGKCKDCGYECEHNYRNGKCTICGEKEPEARAQENALEANSFQSNGIKLMSGIVPMSVDSISITATVEPEDAEIDLQWVLSGIETPEDYIEMQVDEGKKSATLAAKKAFGTVITLTVSSTSNPNASATCSLNYIKRLDSLGDGVFGFSTSQSASPLTISGDHIDHKFDMATSDHTNATSNKIYVKTNPGKINYSVGTKTNDLTYTAYLRWNRVWVREVKSVAPNIESELNASKIGEKTFNGNAMLAQSLYSFDVVLVPQLFVASYIAAKDFSDMRRALEADANGAFPLVLYIEISNGKNTVADKSALEYMIGLQLDPVSFSVKTNSLNLSQSNIDF